MFLLFVSYCISERAITTHCLHFAFQTGMLIWHKQDHSTFFFSIPHFVRGQFQIHFYSYSGLDAQETFRCENDHQINSRSITALALPRFARSHSQLYLT